MKTASIEDQQSPKLLRKTVSDLMQGYLQDVAEHCPHNLLELVRTETEIPLLLTVLKHVKGNQSRAAQLLGISRVTLRTKLKKYHLENQS